MWYFDNIRIKNLYSHADSYYSFIPNELVQFKGDNRDKFKSNGAGKSSILDGLSLALIGETCRKTSKEDFIRNGTNDAEVVLNMHNNFLKKELMIVRQFRRKGTVQVGLYVNKKPVTDLTHNKRDPNRILLDLLGFEREDLFNYFILGQDNKNSFITSNDTKQKEIIARFSNFALLDDIEEKLKIEISETNASYQAALQKEFSIQDKILNFKESQKREKEKFVENKAERIEEIRETIKSYKSLLEEREKDIRLFEKRKEALERDLKELNGSLIKEDLKSLEEVLENFKSLAEENEAEKNKLEREYGKVERQLGGVVKCPKCGTAFIPGDGESIKEIKNHKQILSKGLEQCKEADLLIGRQLASTWSKIHLKESDAKQVKNLERAIEDHGERIIEAEQRLKKSKCKISELKDELIKVKAKVYKPNKTGLKELEDKQNELYNRKLTLEKELSDNEFFLYHIGKKGFKTYLSNMAIQNIEDMTNVYLKKFSDLQIRISGYKILKSKEIREKIDISITRDGITEENFFKFSGGEKSVINICCLLALQRLLNNSVESGGLNFLALDEYIISMDEENESQAINVLAATGITTVLVMQHTISYVKNIVTIIKKKGISKIIS